VQNLRGLSRSFGSLSWEEFDEESFEARQSPERMSTLRSWYWIHKHRARYMSGAYAEALEAGAKAAELTWSSLGELQLLDFHLFHALALAARFEALSPEAQRTALEDIERHQQQLAEWAEYAPSTFRAPERMVSAELARIRGRSDEALETYEEALQAAREHDFIQHVALASELAALYWQRRRVSTISAAYARKARDAYQRWGAKGKVQQLSALWPLLSPDSSAADGSITDTDSTQIDALTVVKAQQAISGEIVLERLVATLLQVAIENAGAQRGALLLPRGGKLTVVAASDSTQDGGAVNPDGFQLPWTLVSYVKRTREHVLIGDASQPHPFAGDVWFTRGQARSILCLPLLRQEDFHGALYLENSLATNAFTPARLSLLGHLASQAAISIENARLYAEVQRAESALRQANDELEQRVEERTQELKQAQARLVDTARAAGMAGVAANVLHNVGNVLTSAIINLQTMRATVGSSRVSRLKKVTNMLEEHREDLATFLTSDPRGNRLSSYLSALADELLRDQSSLQEDMEAMGKHIEHIRAIVRVQQNYARDTLVPEECDLRNLVEDALSIQMPALRRHGVTVTRELATLPRTQLDKHKVLQILINLISNAKNAMNGLSEGARHMAVRLEAEGSTARIQVVDNGMGIAPEIQTRLFSQGFTTREGGHGLGLHSSALAAKMLGGRLTLKSQGPGRGATATLELPLA
jgi:signal transduction histidine kinase